MRRAAVRRSHRGHRTCAGVAHRRVAHRTFGEVGAFGRSPRGDRG
ncbi:hypothetical protein SNL152K_8503 [Streptomyces sp. NL15-2K]|nr:hypothetical protein SNL152K_8503 [Streptomyces sp. NL15-2K]